MNETRGLDHENPQLENSYTEFHPQANMQDILEQSFFSDNDSFQLLAPVSIQDPFQSDEVPLEFGYGEMKLSLKRLAIQEIASHSLVPHTAFPKVTWLARYMRQVSTRLIWRRSRTKPSHKATMTSFNQSIQQQEPSLNSLFAPYPSFELSNQTQQTFQAAQDSTELRSFEQHSGLQSSVSTASGLLSGSMNFDSEILAAEFLDQNSTAARTYVNSSSPPFHSMHACINPQALTSNGSTFNPSIATTDYIWPTTENHLSQLLLFPSLPIVPLHSQRQEDRLLNEIDVVDFFQNASENFLHQNDGTTPARKIVKTSDGDKGSLRYISTGHNNCNISRPKFGTSRPILLPPARKGGRKGALSAQEKKEVRESKKRGICIRCRKTKTKCRGGFPCESCLKNSKATLWIYPCIKADFLDIIQCGSYFLDIDNFQKLFIEVMDRKCMQEQPGIIRGLKMVQSFDAFAFGVPTVLKAWCVAVGPAVLKMMAEIYTQNGAPTGRQIAEAPLWLNKLTTRVLPLIFYDIAVWKPQKMLRMQSIRRMTEIPKMQGMPRTPKTNKRLRRKAARNSPPREEEYLEGTLDTLLWISIRYAELSFFQYLQQAANRLSSLSSVELSDAASGFLTIIQCGLLSDLDGIFNDKEFEENQRVSADYLDRKKRIRIAIFVYLKMTIDKLPAWSNLWQDMPYSALSIDQEGFQSSLTPIEACDAKIAEYIANAKRLNHSCHWRKLYPDEITALMQHTALSRINVKMLFGGAVDNSIAVHCSKLGLELWPGPALIKVSNSVEQNINKEGLGEKRQYLLRLLELFRIVIKHGETIQQLNCQVRGMYPKYEDDSVCEAASAILAFARVFERLVVGIAAEVNLLKKILKRRAEKPFL